mgnify:FL=1
MVSKKAIRICILDPNFEALTLSSMASNGLECQSRHLDPEEIEESLRKETILITTPDVLTTQNSFGNEWGFSSVVVVDGQNVIQLPDLIAKAEPPELKSSATQSAHASIVIGVLPRVGASTINELIESVLGVEIFALRKQRTDFRPKILCSEIDDTSLLSMFTLLNELNHESQQLGVIINKLPRTASARKKFRALERELIGSHVSLVHPIYFDGAIPVSGDLSKQTVRSAQPIFDWIANSN